jgi:N-methylhydantoinase B
MTKAGDRLHFDFTGSAPQTGIINSATSGAMAGVMAALLPGLVADIPWAPGGLQRCLTITNPRGTILNAEYPAAVSMGSITGTWLAHNCAHATLGKMLLTHPGHRERALSSGSGSWPAMQLFGWDKTGYAFVTQFQEANLTGFGARSFADGVNTAGAYCIPSARVSNVESSELVWPLLVLHRGEAMDTGGAGRWRGGLGGKFAFIPHKTDKDFTHVSAAFHVAIPTGGTLCGGHPGASVVYSMKRDTDAQATIARGSVPQDIATMAGSLDVLQPKSQTTQSANDVYSITFFGGGGYGDPLDREAERVARDVDEGVVSSSEAFRIYGVAQKNGAVDMALTERRRRAIRGDRLGHDDFEAPTPEKIEPQGTCINDHLTLSNRRIVCRRCGRDHCAADTNYKLALVMRAINVEALASSNRDPAEYINTAIEFRQFICPGCGTQVETEVALASEPVLWDVQLTGDIQS